MPQLNHPVTAQRRYPGCVSFIFVQWEEMGTLHPSSWATWKKKKKTYVTQLGCSLVTFTLSLIDIRSDLPETHGEAECKCDKCWLFRLNSVYSAHPHWSYNVYTQVASFLGSYKWQPHSSAALCASPCSKVCHLGRIKIKLQRAAFISLEGKWSSKPTLHKVVILTLLLWGTCVGGNDNAAPVTVV